MILKYIILFLILILFSCSRNPTTFIDKYIPPTIFNKKYMDKQISFSIKGYIDKSDFLGINIYFSTNSNIISLINNTNLQPIKNYSDKYPSIYISLEDNKYFETNNILVNLTYNVPVYLITTLYGENEYSSETKGIIESDINYPEIFYPRPQGNFTINNQKASTSSDGLNFNFTNIQIADSADTESAISNSLYFILDNYTSSIKYYLKIGNNTSNIYFQDLGYAESLFEIQKLPTNGYFNKSQSLHILENHIYAIKENNYYYKLYINNIGSSNIISSVTDNVYISGIWAVQIKQNENNL